MHPRNPYRDPPDFAALAIAYPALKPHVISLPKGGSTIDFQDDQSQRRLTEALLSRDFGISVRIPVNKLCPPVPNRLNYVLWIQDLMRDSTDDPVCGIDIGTGASAIYPLLACKLELQWQFTATDIDQESILHAQSNVDRNNLRDRVTVMPASPDGPLFVPLISDALSTFSFTMCNPPFYSSAEDVLRSADAKQYSPMAVCTGADVEMITPGGETVFVSRMVEESLTHKQRVSWYTSMLGKMSSVADIVTLLRQHNIDNYAITEFVQGQTRRWAVGWSFGDKRLPDTLIRISNRTLQEYMPARNTFRQPFLHASVAQVLAILADVLHSVEGVSLNRSIQDVLTSGLQPTLISPLIVCASANTWSRSARRRAMARGGTDPNAAATDHVAMKCCVVVESIPEAGVALEIGWMQGRDRGLFESFCSHVARKVGIGIREH